MPTCVLSCSIMQSLVAKVVNNLPVKDFPQSPAYELFQKYGASAPSVGAATGCPGKAAAGCGLCWFSKSFLAGVAGGVVAGAVVALLLKRK